MGESGRRSGRQRGGEDEKRTGSIDAKIGEGEESDLREANPTVSLFGGIEIPGQPDLENCRKLDLLSLPMIRRAHRIGIAIDPPWFADLSSRFSIEKIELEKDIASYIPVDRLREFSDVGSDSDDDEDKPSYDGRPPALSFNADSPEQVGRLLFDMLNIGTEKQLKRTDSGRISTGKKQLELIKLEHPVVGKVLRHRELSKLISNYCSKLPKLARFHPRSECCPVCELPHQSDQWRVHGEMGTTRAETGRINHTNPNLGNVSNRTEDGREVQAGFVAPPGYRLVKRDLSQIELRTLAHLSNDPVMIGIYENGGDIHDITARSLFHLPEDVKPDKYLHRLAAKRYSFSIANGTTEKGMYLQIVMDFGFNKIPVPDWLTEEWCKESIGKWLETYPEVHNFFEQQWYRARRYGLVWEPIGRVRLIPEVRSHHAWIRSAGLRQAQNFPITALAAQILKLGMGKVDQLLQDLRDSGAWCWPLLTIHDAIMNEVEEDYAEEANEVTGYGMNTVLDDEDTGEHRFRTPIESDGSVSQRWE